MSFSEIDISGPSKPEKENLCFGHDSLDAIFGEEKGIPAQVSSMSDVHFEPFRETISLMIHILN